MSSISKKEIAKKFLESTPKHLKYFAQHSIDLSIQTSNLLKKYNITQKELAKRVNKRESEISKWLSGNHNLTLKSISKLEAAFNEQIIFTQEEIIERISNNIDEWVPEIFFSLSDYKATYSSKKTISFKNGHKNALVSSEISNMKNVSNTNLYLITGDAA